MLLIGLISSFVLCTCFVAGAPNMLNLLQLDGRIVGGKPANISNFPYQLSMEYRPYGEFIHWCGASVIGNYWVLTAAHCVFRKSLSDIRFRSGTSFRETGGELHDVLKIIVHPEYDAGTTDFDVAVVKVSNPFHYSEIVQPITLKYTTPAAGTAVVVTGWGDLSSGGTKARQLQQVLVNIVDRSECNTAYKGMNEITPRMLCAGVPQGGKDSCQADSGGPLAVQDNLVGIVSWGFGCGIKGYAGVYADVAYLRNWIISTIEV